MAKNKIEVGEVGTSFRGLELREVGVWLYLEGE